MGYPSQDMTLNEYQRFAMRTKSDKSSLVTVGLGLCGEAGEVADLIKKIDAQGHALDKDKLIKEVGDVLWYIALAADTLGCTLEDIANLNVQKLMTRYPDGFDVNRSKVR